MKIRIFLSLSHTDVLRLLCLFVVVNMYKCVCLAWKKEKYIENESEFSHSSYKRMDARKENYTFY